MQAFASIANPHGSFRFPARSCRADLIDALISWKCEVKKGILWQSYQQAKLSNVQKKPSSSTHWVYSQTPKVDLHKEMCWCDLSYQAVRRQRLHAYPPQVPKTIIFYSNTAFSCDSLLWLFCMKLWDFWLQNVLIKIIKYWGFSFKKRSLYI